MGVIEIRESAAELTQRQRWSHYFVLIYAAVMFIIALNVRDSILTATVPYSDVQAGIRALYPQNWLLDTEGAYVFRLRDMSRTGFKTTIEVDVLPVTINTSARNLLDSLILTRSQTASGFTVLSREQRELRGEIPATAMTYTFVQSEVDPFLESLPVVVEGIDVLTIQRGQAIVITFLSDARTFDQDLAIFERFLNDLEF